MVSPGLGIVHYSFTVGNKELIYYDSEIACLDPIPLIPRKIPPVIPKAIIVDPDSITPELLLLKTKILIWGEKDEFAKTYTSSLAAEFLHFFRFCNEITQIIKNGACEKAHITALNDIVDAESTKVDAFSKLLLGKR